MACHTKSNTVHPGIELLAEQGFDGLAEAVTLLLNQAMELERTKHLGALPYERTQDRKGYANGFKAKQIKTRLGKLDLCVPQVRDGDFYPTILDRGIRSERALRLAIAEMYVQGVSTRRVKSITQELCGFDISSTDVSRAAKLLDNILSQWRHRPLGQFAYLYLDARYEKIRHAGCVSSSAVLMAFGVDELGKRHVLGVSVSLSEHEVHWRAFLEGLIERGLHGIKLVISDAHSGLKSAREAVFPSVPWQRCQFHLQQNAQGYVPKVAMRREVGADIRAVFNAIDLNEATRLLNCLVEKYSTSAPKLSEWMQDAIPEGLTVMSFPEHHRRRIRTSNIAERVNEEVRRRTRVVGIFPNEDSCLRLVTAIIMEIDEEWQEGRIYFSMDQQ